MSKLNFQHFVIPKSISGTEKQPFDVRELFADIIYTRVNGIKAHHLAMKIYGSAGETEYSDEELQLIRTVAEHFCLPNFIDGLNTQLEGGEA